MKTEYPFIRYNIFYYLHTLSFYPQAVGDPRFDEILSLLRSKTKNGRIQIEKPHRAWRSLLYDRDGLYSSLSDRKYAELESNIAAAGM